jgi:hypothetical protein
MNNFINEQIMTVFGPATKFGIADFLTCVTDGENLDMEFHSRTIHPQQRYISIKLSDLGVSKESHPLQIFVTLLQQGVA